MLQLSLRAARAVLLATGLLVVACGSSQNADGCVDFVIGPDDTSCNVDADCTAIGELHVCPQDPSCGAENAVNVAAAKRYTDATSGVPRKMVFCGAPAPVKCVAKKCTEVTP